MQNCCKNGASSIFYRRATLEDISSLAAMRLACQKESNQRAVCTDEEFLAACDQFFAKGLGEDNFVCWVVHDGDVPVGHIVVQIMQIAPRLEKPQVMYGYIASVYTHSAYRKKGIGTKLMDLAIEWAQKNYNMRALILWANPEAVPFYERMGFKVRQHYPLMEYLFEEHYK